MHYVAWVLIPNEGDPRGHVSRLMAPYDENNDDERLLSFCDDEDEARRQYHEDSVTRVAMPDGSLVPTWDDQFRRPGTVGRAVGGPDSPRRTKTHQVPSHLHIREVPLNEMFATFREFADNWYGEPDEKTGRLGCWRNPRGYWDFWAIGGRWSGMFDGYEPEEDPQNIETCFLCRGTGMRNDPRGLAIRAADPSYTCNGCGGKGKSVKWPTKWVPHHGDVAPATAALTKAAEQTPHTLVTPDGEWSSKEFWDGDDFVDFEGDWDAFVTGQLEKHDGRVTVVDYHI